MCLRILSSLLVVVEIQMSEVFSSSERKVMLHDKKCMDFCSISDLFPKKSDGILELGL
jgi:hypothetical protein